MTNSIILLTSSRKSRSARRSWQIRKFGININLSVLYYIKSKMAWVGFEQFQDLKIIFSCQISSETIDELSNTGRDWDESPNLESESIPWSSMIFKAKRLQRDWEEERERQCYPPLLNLLANLWMFWSNLRSFSGLVREMRTVFQEAVRSEECEGLRSFCDWQRWINLSKIVEFWHIQQSFSSVDSPLRLNVWFRWFSVAALHWVCVLCTGRDWGLCWF
jgi:hypothetical protein